MENFKTYFLDILSVLLPGSLLAAVLEKIHFFKEAYEKIAPLNPPEWLQISILLGVSYTLGHFIFLLGSFLDDWLFENTKKVFWTDVELAAYIIDLKEKKTGIENRRVLNAFKWGCGYLLANKPDMYFIVEKYIAESKFFRSLVVVLLISSVIFSVEHQWNLTIISMILLVLSVIRYLTQRQKSIDTAYEFIITLNDQKLDKPTAQIIKLNFQKQKPKGKEFKIIKTVKNIGKVFVLMLTNFFSKEESQELEEEKSKND